VAIVKPTNTVTTVMRVVKAFIFSCLDVGRVGELRMCDENVL
jgi:hypothetical protein